MSLYQVAVKDSRQGDKDDLEDKGERKYYVWTQLGINHDSMSPRCQRTDSPTTLDVDGRTQHTFD